LKIGIVGGGLAGLCAGLEAAEAGHAVSLYEGWNECGGLAGTFEAAGARLERFYHHVFATDIDFLDLVERMDLQPKLQWFPDNKGNWQKGRIDPFSTPLDILRYPGLSVPARLRLAAASAFLTRVKDWSPYEKITAKEWILKAMGKEVYQTLWEPLLISKFGHHADQISMAWFYGRVKSRFGVGKKGAPTGKLGYLMGSTHLLVEALASRLRAKGGVIHTSLPVRRVLAEAGKVTGLETREGVEACDAVLATCATPPFLEIAGHLLPEALRRQLEAFEYYGACVAVLELSESISPTYWLNVLDKDAPFVAVIEHTRMIPREEYQGRHIVYLARYLDASSPFYRLPPAKVLEEFYGKLKGILPAFDERLVLKAHVMRAEHAQPIVRPGRGAQIAPHQLPVQGLWLANMSQIYPEDRGMSYSIGMGRRVARAIIGKA
jgi:protoporphyrinogen oxidase